ncbi:hypothetical protein RYX36_017562, partial [Vicia faba]
MVKKPLSCPFVLWAHSLLSDLHYHQNLSDKNHGLSAACPIFLKRLFVPAENHICSL